ncbi:MAG: hypothetical protein ABIJ61_08650 [bacterium]
MREQLEKLDLVFDKLGISSIDSFEDLLIMQKAVYLLQIYGVDLGYRFNWHKHGPHNRRLTDDAYELMAERRGNQRLRNRLRLSEDAKKKVERVKRLISERGTMDAAKWLEALACIHYMKHFAYVPGPKSQKNIVSKLLEYEDDLDVPVVTKAWNDLNAENLIKHKVAG